MSLTKGPLDIESAADRPAHEIDEIGTLDIDLEKAACRLHDIMEFFDPTEDPEWDELADYRKQFYKSCLKELIVSDEFIALIRRVPTMT
jgi:hypothetical protein